ncbi:MAG: prepilin-type N-terminal cleavage/methylation domain-containing protein [Pseudomonadota bacterium]
MRGLSLIELLVVLLVLSLAAFVAISNAPRLASDVETEAERFAVRLRIVEDAAAISARPVRLVHEPGRYVFEEYASPDWRPISLGAATAETLLPRGVSLTVASDRVIADNEARLLDRGRARDRGGPQFVVLDPAGLPQTIRAEFSERGRRWSVVRTNTGAVEVRRMRR